MNGKLDSISLTAPSRFRTARGLGIASTAREVRRVYGETLEVEDRPYDGPPSQALTAWSGSGRHGIRFLTDAMGRVDRIDAGGASITAMEGCA